MAKNKIIGWREWVGLPELDVAQIKAKIDTGARTSALHAFDVERFRRRRQDWVRFVIHPMQRDKKRAIHAEAELYDERAVKSSSGHAEVRPVILTPVRLGADAWEIELTLTNRDNMGFRMLLGRQAVRDEFLIDPGRSYVRGKKKVKKKKKT